MADDRVSVLRTGRISLCYNKVTGSQFYAVPNTTRTGNFSVQGKVNIHINCQSLTFVVLYLYTCKLHASEGDGEVQGCLNFSDSIKVILKLQCFH
jgi:hypothetical protein